MPAVYAGSQTPPTTTVWAATTAYTAGTSYVTPTTGALGQYFQCTASGTSGSTQPAWHTGASLPVPGQTYAADGSVTWTCMGSLLTPGFCNVDTPVDSDPAITTSIVRGLKNLANYAASAALVQYSNVWAAAQTFTTIATSGLATLASLHVTGTTNLGGFLTAASALLNGDVEIGDALTIDDNHFEGSLKMATNIAEINGVDTVGNYGCASALANTGTEQHTGIGHGSDTTIATLSAPNDGMYRFSVYTFTTTGSDAPLIYVVWTDPATSDSLSAPVTPTLLTDTAYTYVGAVFAKSGTNVVVQVNPLSTEVCNAFATIEAI